MAHMVKILFGTLIILVNIPVGSALYFMKSVKQTSIIFLSQMVISNVMLGLNQISMGILLEHGALNVTGCKMSVAVLSTTTGVYSSVIFFVYLDIYLSLKTFNTKSPLTNRIATTVVFTVWIFWLIIGYTQYNVLNIEFDNFTAQACNVWTNMSRPYKLCYLSIMSTLLVLLIVCHVATLKLVRNFRDGFQPNPCISSEMSPAGACEHSTTAQEVAKMDPESSATSSTDPVFVMSSFGPVRTTAIAHARHRSRITRNKLKATTVVFQITLTVLIVFFACWTPAALLLFIEATCTSCQPHIPKYVRAIVQVLGFIPYASNALVYVIQSREVRRGFRKICARCR